MGELWEFFSMKFSLSSLFLPEHTGRNDVNYSHHLENKKGRQRELKRSSLAIIELLNYIANTSSLQLCDNVRKKTPSW
jgi:hypothetical protein